MPSHLTVHHRQSATCTTDGEAERPDAILLDVEMPLLDGPGMANRMFVENMGRENIPVILVSGVANLAQVADQVGTPYALAKPYSEEALALLLEEALRERALPRPRM
jgi:FixJ family two-component response regulator